MESKDSFNSPLYDYLNEHFEVDPIVDAEIAGPVVESHFWQKYQVYAKWEGDFFLFKYSQTIIESWDPKHVQECRGIIVERARDSKRWEIVSRPFGKFFNQQEGECPVNNNPTFNKLCNEFYFVEKADGTCVQTWWDRHQSCWKISTLGMVIPDTWVPELFWKLVDKERLTDLLDKDNTYIFELCCEQNRVVTKYDHDTVFLIAIRNKYSGEYIVDESVLKNVAASVGKKPESPIRLPRKFTFQELGITTLNQTINWVEQEAKKESVYGTNPEGFVIYWKGAPLCKLKNTNYLQKHGIVTGDLLYVRNIVIDRFFSETLDDVGDVLIQPPIVEFMKELRQKVKNMMAKAEEIRRDVILKDAVQAADFANNPKLFVDFVKKTFTEKQYSAFFIKYKKETLDTSYESIEPFFFQWLKQNYNVFKNVWKQTNVEAINEKERAVNWQLFPENNKDKE